MRPSAGGRWWHLAAIVGTARLLAAADEPAVVLDVPYVAQTAELCGGAGVAMILRYWGQGRIYAEDFAPLIEPDEGGIPQGALVDEVQRRGWQAVAFSGTADVLRRLLRQGRPILVLLEDGKDLYHYVVVTGWLADRVLVHDPARAPFRPIERATFERDWARADHWSLLILPGTERRGSKIEQAPRASSSSQVCDPLVARGVRLAREGELEKAQSLFESSAELCPEEPAPFRELAAVHLLRKELKTAERLAARAAAIDPKDEHAWRLLGTSRFLQGNLDGALSAFNRAGEPSTDLTKLHGLDRTNQEVVMELLDLAPRSLLTEARFRRARRRLEMLPVALSSRMSFTPRADGSAAVEAAIEERPLFPYDRFTIAADGLRALTERELSLRLANPMHGGELWSLDWRWWRGRPRFHLDYSVPRRTGPGSVWRLDASWEQESYRNAFSTDAERLTYEHRESVLFSMLDWTEADLLWEVTFGVDRFREQGTHALFGGALEKRWAGDRTAIRAEASSWTGGGPFFASGALGWSFRSSTGTAGTQLRARAGIEAASERAPRMLWPGAGVGHAREALLRAHPLLDDGAIAGEIFGRRLVHGSLELERRLPSIRSVGFSIAGFVDLARAHRGMDPVGTGQIDAGGGLRIRLPGQSSALRIDAARGLVDGNFALSFGWQTGWPGWN